MRRLFDGTGMGLQVLLLFTGIFVLGSVSLIGAEAEGGTFLKFKVDGELFSARVTYHPEDRRVKSIAIISSKRGTRLQYSGERDRFVEVALVVPGTDMHVELAGNVVLIEEGRIQVRPLVDESWPKGKEQESFLETVVKKLRKKQYRRKS